jgi:antitoxin VapB
MGLNIKNAEVERLAVEVARMTGETKTEALRKALMERRDRLSSRGAAVDRKDRFLRFLEREIWSRIPPDQLGKGPTKEEVEEILGFGPEGY